ncbi:unnamed protein product [Effrenium voratum]|uniref:Uncharacterized protein n=1 Tax=Effrenium voratum TaxID=2562239 RepID=A0AA36J9A4_9DINO|nr:unnamed protein product [Effrenium voratum]CAJ1429113.1 unnamed protein product [Effrenium voratum]
MRLAKMAPNGAMAPWLVLLGVAGYAWCSGPCSSSGRTFQRGWTTCMADTVLHKLQLQPDPEAVRRGLRSALCLVRTEACALLVSQSRQEVGPLFPCSSSFSQASWTAPAENQAAAELELRRVAAISSEAPFACRRCRKDGGHSGTSKALLSLSAPYSTAYLSTSPTPISGGRCEHSKQLD